MKSHIDKKYIRTCNPTSFASSSSLRLEVLGKINNIDFNFINDTGVTVSIINVKKLSMSVKPKQINYVNIITANGSNFRIRRLLRRIQNKHTQLINLKKV